MCKKDIYCILSFLIITIFAPYLIYNLVQPESVMGVLILEFFFVNTLSAVITGILSAKILHWLQPLIFSLLFLLGAWINYSFSDDFIVYAIAYVIIGYLSLITTKFVDKLLKK